MATVALTVALAAEATITAATPASPELAILTRRHREQLVLHPRILVLWLLLPRPPLSRIQCPRILLPRSLLPLLLLPVAPTAAAHPYP